MIDQESSINNSYGSSPWNFYNAGDPCGFAKNMLDPCEVFACCQAGGAFDFFEEDDAHSVTAPSSTTAAQTGTTDQNKSASSFRTTDEDLDQELENFNIDVDDLPNDCLYSSFNKPEPVVQDRLQAISAQRKKNENNRLLLQERGQKIEGEGGLACTASQLHQNAADYAAKARVLKEKCKNRNHNNIIMRRWRLAARKHIGVKSKDV
jgi:hypothetical protein